MYENSLTNSKELSILKRKRTTLENRLEILKEEIKTIQRDLSALDQTIKLFDTDKKDKKEQSYLFKNGELKARILNEDKIHLASFVNKLANEKNIEEEDKLKKLRASVYTTLYKLEQKGMIQKLGYDGLYLIVR